MINRFHVGKRVTWFADPDFWGTIVDVDVHDNRTKVLIKWDDWPQALWEPAELLRIGG